MTITTTVTPRRNDTIQAILEAGKEEFLTYGYEKASLRRIAGKASVTTGAIYGCFSGKEAIFKALTETAAQGLVELYRQGHEAFAGLSPKEQERSLLGITDIQIPLLLDYVYDHFEAFKLLFCSGAPGAGLYFDQLTAIEEKSCVDFVSAMRKLGYQSLELDELLIHILCSSIFRQIEEFISHDIPKERAVACAVVLGRFNHAGWARIIGMKLD